MFVGLRLALGCGQTIEKTYTYRDIYIFYASIVICMNFSKPYSNDHMTRICDVLDCIGVEYHVTVSLAIIGI